MIFVNLFKNRYDKICEKDDNTVVPTTVKRRLYLSPLPCRRSDEPVSCLVKLLDTVGDGDTEHSERYQRNA